MLKTVILEKQMAGKCLRENVYEKNELFFNLIFKC